MFDHLVKENNLMPVMEEYGLKLPEDLDFIKELIIGQLEKGPSQHSQVLVAVHIIDQGCFYFADSWWPV